MIEPPRLVLVGLGLASLVLAVLFGGDSNPVEGSQPAPASDTHRSPFDRMSRNPPIPRPKWLVASYCVAPEWLTDKSER